MKVYSIEHHYDNGESYEDYREYMDYTLFSDYRKAMDSYCAHIIPEYEGCYILVEICLDTQERTVLEKSPYKRCLGWEIL